MRLPLMNLQFESRATEGKTANRNDKLIAGWVVNHCA